MNQIHYIQAQDTFGYRELQFAFTSGLHSIEGLNGSSKSSVFLTLAQCLMNRHPKGGKIEDVSNKITGQPYHIEATVHRDGHEYRFVNSKKLGRVEIWRDGRDISLKRIPDNLKLIQEILGADFTLLCDLIYQSKDSTLDILETGTDKGRKLFINRVLKLAEIDEQALRMKDKEKELAGKNGRIVALARQIETLESALGEILEAGEEIETSGTEAEISVLADEIGAMGDKKREYEEALRTVQLQIATAEGEQAVRARIAELEASYKPSLLESATETAAQLEATVQEVQALKIALSTLRNDLARAEKAKEQLGMLEEYRKHLLKLGKPDKEKGECLDQLGKITRVHASTKAKLEEVLKKLTPYRKAVVDKVCPTCGSAENWERIGELISQLEAEQAEHEALIEKCEGGQEKYNERLRLWERRERIETEIGKLTMIAPVELNIPEAERRRKSYERKIEILEESAAETKALIAEYHKARELEAQIAKLKASLKGAELAVSMYQEEDKYTAKLAHLGADLKVATMRLASLKERLELVKDNNATIRARREVNRQIAERNTQIQLQISQAKLELANAENRLDCIKEWNGILGNKGFRVARIKRFLTSLNATMVKYSQMICNGRIKAYFYITPEGEVEFSISDAAKEMDYPLWSGGEKARVKLICLFSVLELLEVMGSVSFNVLCLDEVFEALDADGKEGLFKVLEHLKQKGKAVYVIAHSELALDLSYDSVIRAVKREDGTTEIIQ